MLNDVLAHPLLLLAVGGTVSGWILPRLAQRWQDQRKALDMKADLVERVVRSVTDIFTSVQLAQVGARSQSQADFDGAYRRWQNEKAVLTPLLRAYFRSATVDHRWLRCRTLATAYYVQCGISGSEVEAADVRRDHYLRQVAAGISLDEPEDWSEDVLENAASVVHRAKTTANLSHTSVLRSEVRRQLDLTVEAIVDSKMTV